MLATNPHIAKTGGWRFRDFRGDIIVRLPVVGRFLSGQQIGQGVGVKPGQRKIKAVLLQGGEFDLQHRLVPACVLGDAVVGDYQRPTLGRCQMVEHDHRHRFNTELLCSRQPPVASDNDPVTSGQNRVGKAELGD